MEQSITKILEQGALFAILVLLFFGIYKIGRYALEVWKKHLEDKNQIELEKGKKIIKLLEDTHTLLILVENNLPLQQAALSNLTEIIQELLASYNNKNNSYEHLEQIVKLLAETQLTKINEILESHRQSRLRGQEWAKQTKEDMDAMPKKIKEELNK